MGSCSIRRFSRLDVRYQWHPGLHVRYVWSVSSRTYDSMTMPHTVRSGLVPDYLCFLSTSVCGVDISGGLLREVCSGTLGIRDHRSWHAYGGHRDGCVHTTDIPTLYHAVYLEGVASAVAVVA